MKTSSRKILACGASVMLIFLTACSFGGGDDKNGSVSKKMKIFSTDYIETEYPQDWELVESKDFPQGTPSSTVVIFKANIKNELFITNVNIAHNQLAQPINSVDYGKQVIANQKATLQNYKELNRDEIEIPVGGKQEKAILIAFEGKRMATDPVIRFIQLYAVKDAQAYIATTAMLPTEEKSVQLSAEDIVKSLKIK